MSLQQGHTGLCDGKDGVNTVARVVADGVVEVTPGADAGAVFSPEAQSRQAPSRPNACDPDKSINSTEMEY